MMQSSSISQRKRRYPKTQFVDKSEEDKYMAYIKHVNALNKMKEYLGQMHRSMTKEVVKKLVVSIKRMEEDLNFYENNWD